MQFKNSRRNKQIKFQDFTDKNSTIYQLRQSMNSLDQYGYKFDYNADYL